MTLKEFTEKHIKADTAEGEKARWRKAFPTELRYEERVVKFRIIRDDVTKMFLQELWQRIHKGDVIDTEWRDVPAEYMLDYAY